MTIPNLQIHETDFQPETAEYWEISLGAATPFWATPEASELDLYSISEYRLTKRLICIISSIGIKSLYLISLAKRYIERPWTR